MKHKYSPWIALFTGASAGLCPEFMNVVYTNSRYKTIREVWLIDKDLNTMKAIADFFPGKKVRMIVLDVANLQQIKDLSILLKTRDPFIRLMINNTSHECVDDFADYSVQDVENMINVNATAPALLLKICQPYIQIGTVIVMFSSAGDTSPITGNSLSGSAKKFCYDFALSLFYEFQMKGIRITAACTDHIDDRKVRNKHRKSLHLNPLSVTDNQLMAANILEHAENWEASYTPGFFYKFYCFLSRFLSHKTLSENACYFY